MAVGLPPSAPGRPTAGIAGEAAPVAVSAGCPDGILLDVNLPGRDGFAVSAPIASSCPAATIVLTSSDIDDVLATSPDDEPHGHTGRPRRRRSRVAIH